MIAGESEKNTIVHGDGASKQCGGVRIRKSNVRGTPTERRSGRFDIGGGSVAGLQRYTR
jgi:hypothetical protein